MAFPGLRVPGGTLEIPLVPLPTANALKPASEGKETAEGSHGDTMGEGDSGHSCVAQNILSIWELP